MRKWLAEKGLAENTIFVFMTDNGTACGAGIYNSGMRGRKGSEYEGGHRVPFFIHWPKGGLNKGTDISRLTGHIDILPTLLDLCGLTPPEDYKFDGRSLVPLLRNPNADWPARTIITDSQRVRDPIKWRRSSTMTDKWRLINGKELYDIKADPSQKTDIASEHPDVVKTLIADYDAWWKDISPVFKKDARIIIGNSAELSSRLTCHDWLVDKGPVPWNQQHIRAGKGGIGHWALKVETPGKYRITLRRWPASVDRAISASLEKGSPVQGLTALRETSGKILDVKTAGITIGKFRATKPVKPNDKSVSFEVKLKKGEVDLVGYFILNDDTKIGSFYAYVDKI